MDSPGIYVALAGGTEQDQSRIGKLFRHLPLRKQGAGQSGRSFQDRSGHTRDELSAAYDDGKRKYRYVVTAVDRFHNENQGKSKKVKL